MKIKNLNDLKKLVNSLSEEALKQPLLYNSTELSVSGVIQSIEKAQHDLYYTGEDDPAALYTKKQLLRDGMDIEEIESFDIEIPKGSYYIKF